MKKPLSAELRLMAIYQFVFIILLLVIIGCGAGGGGSNSGENSNGSSSGIISMSWNAPTTNADGSTLTDLGGYKIYYGTSSENYPASVDVGNRTSFSMSSLLPGVYCFAVTAYDTSGNESVYSSEVCTSVS